MRRVIGRDAALPVPEKELINDCMSRQSALTAKILLGLAVFGVLVCLPVPFSTVPDSVHCFADGEAVPCELSFRLAYYIYSPALFKDLIPWPLLYGALILSVVLAAAAGHLLVLGVEAVCKRR